MDAIPMTAKGREKLEKELKHLEEERRPKVAQDVAEARELGDLRENGQYHAAREELGMIDAKIRDLKDRLARCTIIREGEIERDVAMMGAKVTVRDLKDKSTEVFQLVGEGEQDYDKNLILVTSPLGQALVGKRVKDKAEVPVPKGTWKLEILKIEYD